MSALQSTKSAARFLGASEASVRRWGDAGLLPVQRVGRRRVRRFAQGDLVRFRKSALGHRSRADVHAVDDVVLGAVRLPMHAHRATFYDSDEGRLRLSLPFLRDGVRLAQPCFLVAAGDTRDRYLDALSKEDGISVESAIEQDLFTIVNDVGTTAKEALDAWEGAFWAALGKGATVLRVIGEMASEKQAFTSESEMLAYEFAFNAISERFPCVVLCQYDVREFGGETILGALKAHPHLLALGLTEVVL